MAAVLPVLTEMTDKCCGGRNRTTVFWTESLTLRHRTYDINNKLNISLVIHGLAKLIQCSSAEFTCNPAVCCSRDLKTLDEFSSWASSQDILLDAEENWPIFPVQ